MCQQSALWLSDDIIIEDFPVIYEGHNLVLYQWEQFESNLEPVEYWASVNRSQGIPQAFAKVKFLLLCPGCVQKVPSRSCLLSYLFITVHPAPMVQVWQRHWTLFNSACPELWLGLNLRPFEYQTSMLTARPLSYYWQKQWHNWK